MEKVKKSKQLFEKTINVFAWLCLLLAVILSVVSFGAAMSGEDNGKEIFGHKILIVNTDSMSKSATSQDEEIYFNAGDLIVISTIKDPANELKDGDVITFFSYNPDSLGKTISHKIRKINYSPTGEITGIVTYGINTGTNDMVEVKPEHLIGKYSFKIPTLGTLFNFLKTPHGFYLSILIPGVLLIIFFSVKIGKVLGKQEYAKIYNKDIDNLMARLESLEGRECSLCADGATCIATSQNTNQTMEQEDMKLKRNKEQLVNEQTTEQATPVAEQPATQQPAGQAPVVYQTVSITCPSYPFAPQPVVYQTAQGHSAPVYQTVTIAPQPVNYQPVPVAYQPIAVQPAPVVCQPMPVQPAPIAYQPMPIQQAPVVYQTTSANGAQVPTAPIAYQPISAQPVPTVCQTVGGDANSTPAQNVNQVVSQTPAPIYVAPVVCQPAPVAEQPAPCAPVENQTPVATTEQKEEVVAPIEVKEEETPAPQVEETVVTKVEEVVEQPVAEEAIIEEAPQPAEEVKEEIAVTEIEEVAQEENEQEDENKLNIPESQKKPFAEKLVTAKEETQGYFNTIHNELVSYKKVSSRISFRGISYRKGRTLLAKMGLRGKTLTGYFNLNVDDFNKNVFFQKDMSSVKAYEEVPFAVKIKSDRACNNATKLVNSLAEKFELVKNPKFEPVDPIKELKEKEEN